MLQIVTLPGDYQYQIAHLCIINCTKVTMGLINFVVLNILYAENSTQRNN